MEHGLKDIAIYVQKHTTPCTVVMTSLLVHDKSRGVPAFAKRVYWLWYGRIWNRLEFITDIQLMPRASTSNDFYTGRTYQRSFTENKILSIWQLYRDWRHRKLTLCHATYGATSHDKVVKLKIFCFQCLFIRELDKQHQWYMKLWHIWENNIYQHKHTYLLTLISYILSFNSLRLSDAYMHQ